MEKFKEDMAVFGYKEHHLFYTYYHRLIETGHTIDEVREYLDYTEKNKIKEEVKRSKIIAKLKKCPECSTPMLLVPVNDSPATQTGDHMDKSVWYCRRCGESIYNRESVKKIITELGIGGD